MSNKCPLCESLPVSIELIQSNNLFKVECKRCGIFTVPKEVQCLFKPKHTKDMWKVAAYSKQRTIQGKPVTFFLSQSDIPAEAPSGSVGMDTAIDMFPRTVSERLDQALMNLAAVTRFPGEFIETEGEGINPLLLAENASVTFFIIQQFEEEGFIKGQTKILPTKISLTAKALNRVADLQRGLSGHLNKQVFVAMAFHESLNEAWTNGLKKGIEESGYTALRVDFKEHNEKICDVIIGEIRRSKFLVSDFTLHRNGVYFEAGLMMGMGRPVIFTCRANELDKAHFDTRQYNHISWENPDDLREKLMRRIQATVAP